jgi:hypothetical protein
MAIDMEAIRRKLAQLNREKAPSNKWKPQKVGNYKIRALPWPANLTSEGTPFIERYFYYIGKDSVLTPKQFGEEDPVNDLISALWRSKDPADKETAKKIMPKMKAYLAVLVKGEEEKGAQLFEFSHTTYKRLLGFYMDEDGGDICDLEEGFDLKVTMSDGGRVWEGKPQLDMTIDLGKQGALSKWFNGDTTKMQELLEKLPSVDETTKFARKSSAEIKLLLDKWTAGPDAVSEEGTTRGSTPTDELDKLADEVAKPTTKKSSKKSDEDSGEVKSKTKTDLDAAFDELMEDD